MHHVIVIAERKLYFNSYIDGLLSKLPWVKETVWKQTSIVRISVHSDVQQFSWIGRLDELRGHRPNEIVLLRGCNELPDWPIMLKHIQIMKAYLPEMVIKNYAGVNLDERNAS